ncbi:MAG: septum formation protein Maf [Lachnospiraceae bacterium]|nr:septum formation protein Maf [Lachnospiraceae bacterium]
MIILASKSPRRKELLENIGIKPLIIVSDADENIDESNPEELVKKLSHIKAQAVYDKIKADKTIGLHEDDYIIGADTIVYANGNVLGKPKDKDDARAMIKTLSGSVHSVYTGFTLIDSEGNTVSKAVETKVYVYEMSDSEIEDYISTDEPYDKAGAYGIQGLFGKYVEKIEGDYNNVVGLPVSAIYNTLHSNK